MPHMRTYLLSCIKLRCQQCDPLGDEHIDGAYVYDVRNIGLSLRWSVAVKTMKEYCLLPIEAIDAFTVLWTQQVHIIDDAMIIPI